MLEVEKEPASGDAAGTSLPRARRRLRARLAQCRIILVFGLDSRSPSWGMENITQLPKSIQDPQTYVIIGAAMEVHRVLGPGFLEGVYQEALGIELTLQRIQHAREVEFPVCYKGSTLERRFRADVVCNNAIIVEVKAVDALGRVDEQQLINYLKVTGMARGLLINFGARSLEVRRFVF
jgi:GxxExxY protein